MDREKLSNAAEEQADYSTHWNWGDRKDCFISGAQWLMQQPLSERLTEEEKEKIRKFYKTVWGKSVNKIQLELTAIFGSDLFREK